jgi:hypothetical protein
MKTLFVSLAAILFALFVGCQDTITDPVVSSTEIGVNKDIIHAYPGVIKLDGTIFDPGHDNFVSISGTVRYDLKHVYLKQRPPKLAMKIGLWVSAEVKGIADDASERWIVNGTSEDVVYNDTVDPAVYYLEKSFKVQNTSPSLDLVLKVRVEGKTLELVSMRLYINEY